MASVRSWRCISCGKFEPWGEGWVWYGSYKLLEDHPEKLEIYCSIECAHRHHPDRLVEILESVEAGE